MKIDELFRRLSYAELSNLSLADSGSGQILEASRPKMIHHVNEALLRLHSRFVLIENTLVLEQVGSITSYPLKYQYAMSNTVSTETHKFIKDTITTPFVVQTFKDDVIKIIQVYDEEGTGYALNDSENPLSLFTPQPNILQIPTPAAGVMLAVTYQARHPKLSATLTGNDLLNQEFDIPFTMEGALQSYVAHLVFSGMNGQENIVKSQELRGKYEEVCVEIEKMDLVAQSISTTNTRFEIRGWV